MDSFLFAGSRALPFAKEAFVPQLIAGPLAFSIFGSAFRRRAARTGRVAARCPQTSGTVCGGTTTVAIGGLAEVKLYRSYGS